MNVWLFWAITAAIYLWLARVTVSPDIDVVSLGQKPSHKFYSANQTVNGDDKDLQERGSQTADLPDLPSTQHRLLLFWILPSMHKGTNSCWSSRKLLLTLHHSPTGRRSPANGLPALENETWVGAFEGEMIGRIKNSKMWLSFCSLDNHDTHVLVAQIAAIWRTMGGLSETAFTDSCFITMLTCMLDMTSSPAIALSL